LSAFRCSVWLLMQVYGEGRHVLGESHPSSCNLACLNGLPSTRNLCLSGSNLQLERYWRKCIEAIL